MSEKLKIPKIRFKEFSGGWDENIFGNIASFSKGKGISKDDIVENGELECIRYGELYTTYGETINYIKSRTNLDKNDLVLSDYNDIIIPASGETQIDIATASCVLKEGVALGGDLNIIKSKNNGVFLSYYLNSKKKFDIANLSQGVSVVHLYSSQLKTLKLNLPNLKEQQKIASFLSSVDEKIEKVKEKKKNLEDYKKGVMQKIFSQVIRFKDDNGEEFGEWDEKSFDDIFESISTKNYQIFNSEILEKGEFKVIDQGQNKVSGYSNNGKKLYRNGPVIIFGDHTTILKYIDFDFVIGADGTKILKNKIGNLYYLYCFLEFNKIKPEGYKRHFSILKNLIIFLPTLKEQEKIADFLFGIDEKIEKVNEELQKMEEFKKGLLQEMFV